MTIDITDYDRLTSDNQVRLLNILLDTNKKARKNSHCLRRKRKGEQMKYDVTTSHMFTQHWIIDAKDKDQAAEKVANGKIKFDKTSRKFVSDKLTMGLVTIPDVAIRSVEPVEGQEQGFETFDVDVHGSYGGTDPE